MRILLVKGAPFNAEVPQFAYPLGVMYLASFLRSRHPEHEQKILDLNLTSCGQASEALRRQLRDFDPHIVAISALTSEAASLHDVARAAKDHSEATVVLAGGPHVSACTQDVIEDTNVDALAFGEGEETYAEVVQVLSEARRATGVPGTAWREDGELRRGPERAPIADLDALPFPAWDLVDIDAYAKHGRAGNIRRNRYMGLFTSRGCPYECSYCHRVFPKRFRARSAANVLEEIELLAGRYGIRDFEIYDDAFNLDLPRSKAICQGMLDLGLGFALSFPNGVRADRLDEELVGLLAQAGTTNMAIAVDTVSPTRQRALGRRLNLERVRQAIRWANSAGIITIGYFMLGFPGETRAEMQETIRFAVESELFFGSFFIVTPYPGTPLWQETVGAGGSMPLEHRELNVFSGYFNLSEVEGRDLRKIQRSAYWSFYWRRLPKILLSLPRLRVDWRNAAWIAYRRLIDRSKLRKAVRPGPS